MVLPKTDGTITVAEKKFNTTTEFKSKEAALFYINLCMEGRKEE